MVGEASEVDSVWRWVTGHRSSIIFRILCVPVSVVVGGALMAFVLWWRKTNLKGRLFWIAFPSCIWSRRKLTTRRATVRHAQNAVRRESMPCERMSAKAVSLYSKLLQPRLPHLFQPIVHQSINVSTPLWS